MIMSLRYFIILLLLLLFHCIYGATTTTNNNNKISTTSLTLFRIMKNDNNNNNYNNINKNKNLHTSLKKSNSLFRYYLLVPSQERQQRILLRQPHYDDEIIIRNTKKHQDGNNIRNNNNNNIYLKMRGGSSDAGNGSESLFAPTGGIIVLNRDLIVTIGIIISLINGIIVTMAPQPTLRWYGVPEISSNNPINILLIRRLGTCLLSLGVMGYCSIIEEIEFEITIILCCCIWTWELLRSILNNEPKLYGFSSKSTQLSLLLHILTLTVLFADLEYSPEFITIFGTIAIITLLLTALIPKTIAKWDGFINIINNNHKKEHVTTNTDNFEYEITFNGKQILLPSSIEKVTKKINKVQNKVQTKIQKNKRLECLRKCLFGHISNVQDYYTTYTYPIIMGEDSITILRQFGYVGMGVAIMVVALALDIDPITAFGYAYMSCFIASFNAMFITHDHEKTGVSIRPQYVLMILNALFAFILSFDLCKFFPNISPCLS